MRTCVCCGAERKTSRGGRCRECARDYESYRPLVNRKNMTRDEAHERVRNDRKVYGEIESDYLCLIKELESPYFAWRFGG